MWILTLLRCFWIDNFNEKEIAMRLKIINIISCIIILVGSAFLIAPQNAYASNNNLNMAATCQCKSGDTMSKCSGDKCHCNDDGTCDSCDRILGIFGCN